MVSTFFFGFKFSCVQNLWIFVANFRKNRTEKNHFLQLTWALCTRNMQILALMLFFLHRSLSEREHTSFSGGFFSPLSNVVEYSGFHEIAIYWHVPLPLPSSIPSSQFAFLIFIFQFDTFSQNINPFYEPKRILSDKRDFFFLLGNRADSDQVCFFLVWSRLPNGYRLHVMDAPSEWAKTREIAEAKKM